MSATETSVLDRVDGSLRETPSRWSLTPARVLVAVSAAFVLVALTLAGRQGFWVDEGFTAAFVRQPWSDFLHQLTKIDTNMASYDIVAKMWVGLFGTAEVAMRSLSIAFVVATFPVAYRLFLRIYGKKTATFAVVLLAINPWTTVVAITVRPYAMLLFISALSSVLLLRALESNSRSRWVGYALLCVVGLYTHLTMAFVFAAQGVFALLRRRRIDRDLLLTGAIVALGAIPTVLWIAPTDTLDWIGGPSIRGAWTAATIAAGGTVAFVITAALLATAVRPLFRSLARAHSDDRALPVVMLVVPAILMLAVTPIQPLVDVDLYLTLFLLPLAGVLAMAVFRFRPSQSLAVIGVLVAAYGGTLIWTVAPAPGYASQGWKEAAAILRRDSRPDEAIAFPNSYARIPVELYSRHDGKVGFAARPVLPSAGWGTLSPYGLDRNNRLRLERGPDHIRMQLAGVERLWVVGYVGSTNPGGDMGDVDQAARARGLRLDREYRFGDTLVRHYS